MKVAIVKNKKIKETTMSAFKNFFENAGWELVNEKSSKLEETPVDELLETEQVEVPEDTESDSNDDEWDEAEDDIEKPISEMDKSELIEFANQKGIDIEGLTKASQIREKIKSEL